METTIESNFRMKYIIKSVLFCIVFTALLVVFSFAKGFIPNNFERLAHGTIGTFAAFLATVLFLKFDRKRFSDIGLTFQRQTITKFFTGVVVGIGIMGFLATGDIYFTGVVIVANQKSNVLNFLLMTLPLIPLAFMEELGFRAYPLEILKDKVGIRLAILITSILFALYHIVNGWTIASSFYGPGTWGLIFGLAAVYSRGIAMPTGIHYAANLTTSALGGIDDTISIWTVRESDSTTTKYGGVDWTTLLPALALLVSAIICIELYMRRKIAAKGALAK
jgi:membrane protease YdiL (CAAX protease family)